MKFSSLIRKALVGASFIGMATSFGGESVQAASETANLTVDATVLSSCSITTLAVNFGTYDPMGTHATAALNAQGEVRVTCVDGLPINVRLDQGATPDGASTPAAPVRQMAGTGTAAGDFLAYNLFTDAGRTDVWGDTALTGVDDTGSGVEEVHLIYGQVPAGQNPQAGDYLDTVVASVWF